MTGSSNDTTGGPRKGTLICPACGHTSAAIDGDWIVIAPTAPGRRYRCPRCDTRFGDRAVRRAPA